MPTITPVSKPISNIAWSQDTEMPADGPAALVAYIVLELSSVVMCSKFIRALSLLAHLLLLAAEGVGV